MIADVAAYAKREGHNVVVLAMAVQRTSAILWDKATGVPVCPMYSWQDTRTAGYMETLREEWAGPAQLATGMNFAPGTPMHLHSMIKENGLLERAQKGELLGGTMDSWLIWRFTGGIHGGKHFTSYSNVGTAGYWNTPKNEYWTEFLDVLDVPVKILPAVLDEDGDYGTAIEQLAGIGAPITGVVGDQQSALYGQGGLAVGSVKCTHGTGSFVDFNIGDRFIDDLDGLDCRAGWRTRDNRGNVIEGGTYVSGSAIEWLIHQVHLLDEAKNLDATYASADPYSGVIVVPSFAGFAAPNWDVSARAAIYGLHRGSVSADIVRATVDGISHTIVDLLDAMAKSAGITPTALYMDGGLSRSDALLQSHADLLRIPVIRASNPGWVTALGAAHIAGIKVGVWDNQEQAAARIEPEKTFYPIMRKKEAKVRRKAWQDAVERALGWREPVWPHSVD